MNFVYLVMILSVFETKPNFWSCKSWFESKSSDRLNTVASLHRQKHQRADSHSPALRPATQRLQYVLTTRSRLRQGNDDYDDDYDANVDDDEHTDEGNDDCVVDDNVALTDDGDYEMVVEMLLMMIIIIILMMVVMMLFLFMTITLTVVMMIMTLNTSACM